MTERSRVCAPCAQLAVPALLYTLQNNMLYVGFTHVEVAVGQVLVADPAAPLNRAAALHAHTHGSAVRTVGEYLGGYLPRYLGALLTQVCYQTKILFTAVCSVLLLGRSLSMNQWLALVILTIGIICVQATAAVVVPGSSGG